MGRQEGLKRHERTCLVCGAFQIEDTRHFLVECAALEHQRQTMWKNLDECLDENSEMKRHIMFMTAGEREDFLLGSKLSSEVELSFSLSRKLEICKRKGILAMYDRRKKCLYKEVFSSGGRWRDR